MYALLLFVSTLLHSRKKTKFSLSCLLTYVDYLMHLVQLEYLLRCRCCYYLTVKKLFDFFYFSHSYISETGTRKKGEMKNQDWLWRQHRPHTRFVKARNVTHLSLLYIEFLTLFVWEFQVSRRHEQKCILLFFFLLSTEFISSHFLNVFISDSHKFNKNFSFLIAWLSSTFIARQSQNDHLKWHKNFSFKEIKKNFMWKYLLDIYLDVLSELFGGA